MKNIIILTSGLSGSSVVTNLLSRAGFWPGKMTCKKTDYDTHENTRLVELNEQLLRAVNYEQEYSYLIRNEKPLKVAQLINEIDLIPFKAFITECSSESPWIWKDPRLWVTMPFWVQLLEKNSFQLFFVDRSISQRWISELLRKNVQTFGYCKQYNTQIEVLITQFISKHNLTCCNILFDDLIMYPEDSLLKINNVLGSALTVNDLESVYNKKLYKNPRGIKSLLLAVLIYLKNYRDRLKIN